MLGVISRVQSLRAFLPPVRKAFLEHHFGVDAAVREFVTFRGREGGYEALLAIALLVRGVSGAWEWRGILGTEESFV